MDTFDQESLIRSIKHSLTTFNVGLYLNNDQQTQVAYFYDILSNPFKVGDIIDIAVDEVYPKDLNGLQQWFTEKLVESNNELYNNFHHRKIRIKEEKQFITIKASKKPKLVIEYYCEYVNMDNI